MEQQTDDGKLSLDEFQAFFSDGTLNEEELEKLFHTIDSDNTSPSGQCLESQCRSERCICLLVSRPGTVSLTPEKNSHYFAKHMGDYEGVLASLETLNLSILKAMDFTKKSAAGGEDERCVGSGAASRSQITKLKLGRC
ncbi:unnamed protein product [Pleuronectes platessa]|uniref:Uncharacterized protein n=1 Tax=Pleuronectes platessa TaxID=8262 RepID=A0A9N7UHI1_PLEPL|nr:unnamed protein product [Pleuronectes platessa]